MGNGRASALAPPLNWFACTQSAALYVACGGTTWTVHAGNVQLSMLHVVEPHDSAALVKALNNWIDLVLTCILCAQLVDQMSLQPSHVAKPHGHSSHATLANHDSHLTLSCIHLLMQKQKIHVHACTGLA